MENKQKILKLNFFESARISKVYDAEVRAERMTENDIRHIADAIATGQRIKSNTTMEVAAK
jgi:hypothetical protein